MPPSDETPYTIPPGGSLGLLAAGYRGLQAWREVRGTDWIDAKASGTDAPPEPVAPALAGATVVVVTGLPRSGTSMVMQMVEAAGIAPFSDGEREADASNPRGYYEHERVKRLAHDAAWVAEADGQALKVVAPLLPSLPPGPRYRVVLIERDLGEVLRSQAAMLARDGRTAASADVLGAAYRRYLAAAHAWADQADGVLRLAHADVLADPAAAARQLEAFLGAEGTANRIAAVVDRSLHRQTA